MSKIPADERRRRLLAHVYTRVMEEINTDNLSFRDWLGTLDALQDCIATEPVTEWTISKNGRLRWL